MMNILPFISLGLSVTSLIAMVIVTFGYRRIIRLKDKLVDKLHDALAESSNLTVAQDELIATLFSVLESEGRVMVISKDLGEHYNRPPPSRLN